MKKIILFAVAAMLCGSMVAQKAKIKTENDSISYAYGLGLAEQGLKSFLIQTGVIADNDTVITSYRAKIDATTDPTVRAKLEKELESKLDAIKKSNDKNLSLLINGINDRFDAKAKDKAYFDGVALANQLAVMIPGLSAQMYGEDKKDEINNDMLLAGLFSALKGEKPLLESPEIFVQQKKNLQYAAKDAEAKRFFEENKTVPGVVTLPSGLQYKVITAGDGAIPSATDKVKVHYTGTLLDGTTFDSSIDRGEPITFAVNGVIKGWTEALQLMPVGSKWMLYLPSELAYGAQGAGDVIKPFTPLIFEVELLGIE